jgi:transposase
MIRVLGVARRGALKAQVAAAEQLHGVVYSALTSSASRCSDSRPRRSLRALCGSAAQPLTSPTAATKTTLRTLARRWHQLQTELTQLDCQLQLLVASTAPTLLALAGSGPTPPASCWSPPATTPSGCAQRPPSPTGAAPPRSLRPRAAPTATG